MELFDDMVRQKCGLLTDQQRSLLNYRTITATERGSQTLLNSGRVAETGKIAQVLSQAGNPLLGMLEIQRSMAQTQARAENIFDTTTLPLANDFTFSYNLPIDRILSIIDGHVAQAMEGMQANQVIDSILDDITNLIGEDRMETLHEEKAETGSFGTGNKLVDELMGAMEMARGTGDNRLVDRLKGMVDMARDDAARHSTTERILVGQTDVADERADLEEFRVQYQGRPLSMLQKSYKQKVQSAFGPDITDARRIALQTQGLTAPSKFKNLTKQQRFDMYEKLWGDGPGAYQNALNHMDRIAMGEIKPNPKEVKTETLAELEQELGTENPVVDSEQERPGEGGGY